MLAYHRTVLEYSYCVPLPWVWHMPEGLLAAITEMLEIGIGLQVYFCMVAILLSTVLESNYSCCASMKSLAVSSMHCCCGK